MANRTETAKAVIDIDGQLATEEMVRIKKQAKDLRKEINALYKEETVDIKNLAAKEKQLQKLTTQEKKYKNERKQVNKELKKSTGIFTKLKGLLPAIGLGTLVAGMTALINKTKEFNKVQTKTAQLTKLQGKELKEMTSQVLVLSKVFEKDYNDILLATNTFAKEMGITHERALDLIEEGFEKGADASGDFLQQLKEYPAQLKAVGLQADESIALITQQVQEGIFSDKGIDAIKEAGIRLREMTPATKDALELINISAVELKKQLNDGTISMFEAIQKVSKKLGEMPETANEVGTAIADIFGGPGEDAGLRYLKSLANINTELSEIEDNSTDLTKSQREMRTEWVEFTNSVTSGGGFITKTLVKINGFITGIIRSLRNLNMTTEDIALEGTFERAKNNVEEFEKSLTRNNKQIISDNKVIISQYKEYLSFLDENSEEAKQLNLAIQDLIKTNENLSESQKELTDSDLIDIYKSKIEDLNSTIVEQQGQLTEDIDKKTKSAFLTVIATARNEIELIQALIDELNIKLDSGDATEFTPGTTDKEKEKASKEADKKRKEAERKRKEELKLMTDALKESYLEELRHLKEKLLNEEITQDEFNKRDEELELAHLQAKQLILLNYGESIVEIENEILDKQLEIIEKIKEAEIQADEERKERKEKELEDLENEYREKVNQAADFGAAVGQILGKSATDSEMTAKDAAKQILLLSLKTMKNIVRQAIISSAVSATVQSLAQPDSVATFGITGLIRAAVLVGLMEAAFAGIEGSLNKTTQLYVGGHTGSGGKYEPKGTVHANEYVISMESLADPTVAGFVSNYIEPNRISRIKNISSTNDFVDGGQTSPGTIAGPGTGNTELNNQLATNNVLMAQMLEFLKKDPIAIVPDSTSRDIGDKIDESKAIEDFT